MSSATYPLGMKTNNNHVYIGGYKTWKGTGINSNPVATTAGNIPPQTNKDYYNTTVYKHGLTRPMKWAYRRGTSIQVPRIIINPEDSSKFIEIPNSREVHHSATSSLIGQTIDRPGQYSIKDNTLDNEERDKLDCRTCKGISLVANYYPNKGYITENPIPETQQPSFCCNAQKKALKLVRPASTNLSKRYFTTHQQYMYNRCQTYEQRAFNFYTGSADVPDDIGIKAKPGSPLSLSNFYVAQCYPNTDYEPGLKGCKKVIYKPSNYQFAVEGGVESSARTLKLTLTTIERSIAMNKRAMGINIGNPGGAPAAPFIYKSKVPKCNPAYSTMNGNPRTCNKNTNDIVY